jgi:hypothetical protein
LQYPRVDDKNLHALSRRFIAISIIQWQIFLVNTIQSPIRGVALLCKPLNS